MFDIVSIGSVTRDVLVSTNDFKSSKTADFSIGQELCFSLGSKLEIEKIVFASGGGGTNTAVTFARQELNTACIGVIGNDLSGRDIVTELQGEGINTFFQVHDDSNTAYSIILVDRSGERTILSFKGEGQHFNVDQILFSEIETKWLYLNSLGGHLDLLEKAVNWANEKEVKIATDPGGKELDHGLEKLRPFLNKMAIVHMNQEEASKLTGIDYRNETEIFKLMDGIISGIFIMSKGPEGVVVSDGHNLYRAGIPDSPIIERTGAGDAFTSGFVSEFIRSGNIEKSIQFGTANASSVVSQYGAKAGILKKGDMGPWPLVKVEISQL